MRAYRLMGIVNVTPDSFSDGGRYLDAGAAVAHGIELAGQGASILDVGGESTRPGAEPVAEAEELRRVVPAVEGLAAAKVQCPGEPSADVEPVSSLLPKLDRAPVQISIDTSKAAVARAALAAGASMVNDVTALRGDPDMAEVVAAAGCDCCLMHMQGEPATMQDQPRYGDVVDEVKAFLEERMELAVREGIAEERILLDPGIGFGKTVEHNLTLLRRLEEIAALGRLVVVGTSRKGFLGRVLGGMAPRCRASLGGLPAAQNERLPGTIATNVIALERGASVFRVHDVGPVADALQTAAATLAGTWTESEATS